MSNNQNGAILKLDKDFQGFSILITSLALLNIPIPLDIFFNLLIQCDHSNKHVHQQLYLRL